MCGIFFVKKSDDISVEKVNVEFEKSKNRGGIPPDDTKFYEIGEYYLGFHRLSINGLNTESNQPFYKNGTYVICNGEIYNYKELYSYIGIKPLTNSDCEIIIDLYQLYPIDYFINLLDGVFSFIIYDTRKNVLMVARDPFGVRPLYYSHDYNNFSSELKQINNLTTETITQFPPGHFLIKNSKTTVTNVTNITNITNVTSVKNEINVLNKYHTLTQYYMPLCNQFKNFGDERNYYKSLIKGTLINAVKKRLLSDRPIACLLSGGLDSSLITSIVVNLLKDKTKNKLETFSIGLPGSTDLVYAKNVANYLGTTHTEIILTEDDFFNAIPEVIEKIESYDTTTVRASVGNYLISKYISQNSEAKVIFNGDGSDELTGGYLYFHKAPNSLLFDFEVKNLLQNIHYFDVLRSDKSISSCGLEPRTPFLDKTFVNTYLSIPLYYRKPEGNEIEKKILRDSFIEFLPRDVLYRKKEAFSDGVSGNDRSWYQVIAEKLKKIDIPIFEYNEEYLSPKTKEQMYYRYLFEQKYPKRENVIPYFWMPKWSNTTDPSARTL
jgi:asparagine synthase (glutamine-hydrolysing)